MKRAFTLIEILIVICIIGLLSLITFNAAVDAKRKAKSVPAGIVINQDAK